MEYLPGNDEFAEDADWVINRLVERDIRSLPHEFLGFHQQSMPPYRGMFGEIVETEEFASAEECAKEVCRAIAVRLVSERSLGLR